MIDGNEVGDAAVHRVQQGRKGPRGAESSWAAPSAPTCSAGVGLNNAVCDSPEYGCLWR